jgi:hypothetical protein
MMNILSIDFFEDKRVAYAAACLAGLFLLIALIQAVTDWWPVKAQVVVAPIVVEHQPKVVLETIVAWHLFGDYASGALPKTNLQLLLKGVFTQDNAKESTAIIAVPGSRGKVYRPGDTIPDGAVLNQVLPNGVVLRNQGKLETLPLVRHPLQFQSPPPSLWHKE